MQTDFDLIVCGAGPSGLCAALSAARQGISVLLVDKNGFPGGMNTAALVGPLMTFHAGRTQIARGIAQEIVDALHRRGGTLGHIPDPIGMVSTITPVDPELLKQVYFELLAREKNITPLFHSFITAADVRGAVPAVTVAGKGGLRTYTARKIIDATGDGDVAALCGAAFHEGRDSDGFSQPMTLMFTLDNVNRDQVIAFMRDNPDQFVLDKQCDLRQYVAVSGFFDLVQKAQQQGRITFPRDRVLFFEGVHPGTVTVNMTRVIQLRGTDGHDLSAAEQETHRQLDETLSFLRSDVPGFAQCTLRSVGVTGVRESRRIQGVQTLTADDIAHNREQPDAIGICAYPIDIHDPTGKALVWTKEAPCCYDIPYGIMVPADTPNLLVAGRCVSATHEALASVRISAACMVMGQAAGTAAALAVKTGTDFAALNTAHLQSALLKQNAIPGKRWL